MGRSGLTEEGQGSQRKVRLGATGAGIRHQQCKEGETGVGRGVRGTRERVG